MREKFSIAPWQPGHLGRSDMRCQCRSVCNEGYAGGIATIVLGNGLPITEGDDDEKRYQVALAKARGEKP